MNTSEGFISAVLSSPKHFTIEKRSIPELSDSEILIKLEGCGVCASNLPLWQGRPWFNYPQKPGAPGHEGWGRIVCSGKKVTRFKTGERVAFLSFSSFASFDIVEEANVVAIPKELDSTPFPGEPFGCVMNILERSQIKKGQNVAIIGSGFIGNTLCQLLRSSGVQTTVISKRQKNLSLSLKNGATKAFLLTNTTDLINTLNGENPDGYDRVIETCGYQEALTIAGEIVKTGGKIIIAGYHQDGLRTVNMQVWNWKGIDVINAHERDTSKCLHGMSKAIEAISKKIINPSVLYTHQFNLSEISEAFELLNNSSEGFIKALVFL